MGLRRQEVVQGIFKNKKLDLSKPIHSFYLGNKKNKSKLKLAELNMNQSHSKNQNYLGDKVSTGTKTAFLK